MFVDDIDARILEIVQRRGRATLDDLSQATGLSSSQCSRRLKRMESGGLIKPYVALVKPEAVGFPLQVFTLMSVGRDDIDTFDRFGEAIRTEPTVISASVVSGQSDFLLWAVARDMTSYRDMLRRFTDAFPSLRNVTTLFLLEEVKPGFAVPIEPLGAHEPSSSPRDR